MRNLLSAYNAKNVNGPARWDHDREEARLRRLGEVKAAVQSRRPPRPQGQTNNQAASRVQSASSRRPTRARSASAQRCHMMPASARDYVDAEPQSATLQARNVLGQLDPRFLLSPGRRQWEAQKYLSNADEAAALREEMQDWYFGCHDDSASKDLNAACYVDVAMDLSEQQRVGLEVKPRSAALERPDSRRRSPYAVDLRQRIRGPVRPRSVPPNLVRSQGEPRYVQPVKAQVLPSMASKPPLDLIARAASELPQTLQEAQGRPVERPPSPVVPVREATQSQSSTSRLCSEGSQAPVSETPPLRTTAAIESWLSEANSRLLDLGIAVPAGGAGVVHAEIVAHGSSQDSHHVRQLDEEKVRHTDEVTTADGRAENVERAKEWQSVEELKPGSHAAGGENRVDSLSATGTTVYASTNRPTSSAGSGTPAVQSPVGFASIPSGSPTVVFSPSDHPSSAPLDLTLSRTELPEASLSPVPAAALRSAAAVTPATDAQSPLPATESSAVVTCATEPEAPSDSDHFSQDEFDEEEEKDAEDSYSADEDDASLDASGVSAEVLSDRGSSHESDGSGSVHASSSNHPPLAGICAAAAREVGEERSACSDSIDSASSGGHAKEPTGSRSLTKNDSFAAKSSTLSYDEDFEASDDGASLSGA